MSTAASLLEKNMIWVKYIIILGMVLIWVQQHWLVVFRHPSETYEFVGWDDDIPNIWKKCSKPPTRTSWLVNIIWVNHSGDDKLMITKIRVGFNADWAQGKAFWRKGKQTCTEWYRMGHHIITASCRGGGHRSLILMFTHCWHVS